MRGKKKLWGQNMSKYMYRHLGKNTINYDISDLERKSMPTTSYNMQNFGWLTFRIKGLKFFGEIRVSFFLVVVKTFAFRINLSNLLQLNDVIAAQEIVFIFVVVVVVEAVLFSTSMQIREEICVLQIFGRIENAAQLFLGRRHRLTLDVQQRLDVLLQGVTSSLPGPEMTSHISFYNLSATTNSVRNVADFKYFSTLHNKFDFLKKVKKLVHFPLINGDPYL